MTRFERLENCRGIKIAHTRSYKLATWKPSASLQGRGAVNAPLAADTFAIPDAVKNSRQACGNRNVPYQWVIRRIFLARFTDSDAIYFPPNGSFSSSSFHPMCRCPGRRRQQPDRQPEGWHRCD